MRRCPFNYNDAKILMMQKVSIKLRWHTICQQVSPSGFASSLNNLSVSWFLASVFNQCHQSEKLGRSGDVFWVCCNWFLNIRHV